MSLVGAVVEAAVGPVAHGGHCVARPRVPAGPPGAEGAGQVVFVRHALPGERVRAVVTEQRKAYLRADTVEVLDASPDRVAPPCPFAGRCGGCDFQHVAPDSQRELKAAVVREQLVRLARLAPDDVAALGVQVQPLSGGMLGWRSRVRYAVDGEGRLGFRRHRANDVVAVDRCRIAHPAIQALPATARRWPRRTVSVTAVASSTGETVVTASGRRLLHERAAGREWTVASDGFWQVHPSAPDVLAGAVVEFLRPRPGERVWDLYGGAGLFGAALAVQVGPSGAVTVVESDPRGAGAARRCLADLAQIEVVESTVESAVPGLDRGVDVVVLDPPRAGAGAQVVQGLAAAAPRALAYVSCDPATFARDLAVLRTAGYELTRLRAYDAFPMTHHVELVGLFARTGAPAESR